MCEPLKDDKVIAWTGSQLREISDSLVLIGWHVGHRGLIRRKLIALGLEREAFRSIGTQQLEASTPFERGS